MAVWSWATSGSTWANTTEQTVASAAVRVKKIEIFPNQAQSAIAYFDLWDASNPTPATTTPTLRIPIPSNTTSGLKRKIDAIFPNGGIRFGTALTAFCSSDGGATAVLTTTIPLEIRVHYDIGGN